LNDKPLLTSPSLSSIAVTTSSGIHGPPITEWVLSSLLALTRETFTVHHWQREHKWGDNKQIFHKMSDWAGKTVGIAGYGSIGRQVARALVGLGVKVHAYTARARKTSEERRDGGWIVGEKQGWGLGDREGTLPVAWYSEEDGQGGGEKNKKAGLHTFLRSGLSAVVVSLPLTPATTGLFGKEEFEILRDGVKDATAAQPDVTKPEIDAAGCYFVNIARGKMVDQDALIEALNTDVLKGAALDVTEPEPLGEESKLWDAKNTIVSPHVSGLGREYAGRSLEIVVENVRRLLGGASGGLVNEVTRGRGY
jgi:phosphoglycerate dehydrogenase-like enzyme